MKKEVVYKGTSVWSIYTIIMLILKLTGIVNISWWWVFAPQLIILAIFLLLLLILGILTFIK